MRTNPPGFMETLRLVTGLRLRLALRRGTAAGRVGGAVSLFFIMGFSALIAGGAFWLYTRAPDFDRHMLWMAFFMALGAFLLGLFWILWPVVASHIDESVEMRRYLRFPLRPARLYFIHTLVALVEPAALFFYLPLGAMVIAVGRVFAAPWPPLLALSLSFVLMNVACGRMLQNLFLGVMSSRRSLEAVVGGFLLLLGLSWLLPPVDVSWLRERLAGVAASERDLAILASTAYALAQTPPGLLIKGLGWAATEEPARAWYAACLMLAIAGACWASGLWLLKRWVRGGRGRAPARSERRRNIRGAAFFLRGPLGALAEKELKILYHHPKARLVFAVPFFLLVLLKILGGVALAEIFLGERWAALLWLMLGGYALTILSGNFFANGFGYDGRAVKLLFTMPAAPACWIYGRNLGQALFALAQFALLGLMVFSLPGARGDYALLAAVGFLGALFFLLGAGNLLSVSYPRRFHYDLSRRDRPPAESAALSLAVIVASTLAQMAISRVYLLSVYPAIFLQALWLVMALLAWRRSLELAGGKALAQRESMITALMD